MPTPTGRPMFVRLLPILERGWVMPFSRTLTPTGAVTGDLLTSYMAGIGMNFAVSPFLEPNIEDTLLFASIEGMEKNDLRVLAMLITWFGVHAPWVNADRLTKLIAAQKLPRVRALWSALAQGQSKDRRFVRLAKLYVGPRNDLTETGTEFQVARHGEDSRFEGSPLRVASNILRNRARDVLQAAELAKRHHAYRCRLMMGPSYRADMWAALEEDPTLSAAALARRAYGSFATAWHVRRDFRLLPQAHRRPPLGDRAHA
jgi:hypothetical protein